MYNLAMGNLKKQRSGSLFVDKCADVHIRAVVFVKYENFTCIAPLSETSASLYSDMYEYRPQLRRTLAHRELALKDFSMHPIELFLTLLPSLFVPFLLVISVSFLPSAFLQLALEF